MSLIDKLLKAIIIPTITESWGMCDICEQSGYTGYILHEGAYVRMCKDCISVVIGKVHYVDPPIILEPDHWALIMKGMHDH